MIGQLFTDSEGKGISSLPVSSPITSELTPAIMPKPSQVTGPTTTNKDSNVTTAAATRG